MTRRGGGATIAAIIAAAVALRLLLEIGACRLFEASWERPRLLMVAALLREMEILVWITAVNMLACRALGCGRVPRGPLYAAAMLAALDLAVKAAVFYGYIGGQAAYTALLLVKALFILAGIAVPLGLLLGARGLPSALLHGLAAFAPAAALLVAGEAVAGHTPPLYHCLAVVRTGAGVLLRIADYTVTSGSLAVDAASLYLLYLAVKKLGTWR